MCQPILTTLSTVDEISLYNPGDPESKVQKIVYFVRQTVEDFLWFFVFALAPFIICSKISIDFYDKELTVVC